MSPGRVNDAGASDGPAQTGGPARAGNEQATGEALTPSPPPEPTGASVRQPQEDVPVLPPPPTTVRGIAWKLLASTVGACMRYRVTGLAAEAAFFAILSLPPLVFGLAGSIGYVANRWKVTEIDNFKTEIIELSRRALTDDTVDTIIRPTLNQVLDEGRVDVISIGFVLALWSGSRALNVFVDTITIMYGLGGRRGIVRTRALSFTLYVVALLLGIVVVPLILAGPALVSALIPEQLSWLQRLYWPTVLLLTVAFITTLYHLSVPVRTSWRYDIPGAILTLVVWIAGSWGLRATLQGTVGGDSTSIYGPLATPIAVLLWLFLLSIAVLIGAALNAAFDRVFPEKSTARARLELVRRLRDKAMAARMREVGLEESGLGGFAGAAREAGPEAEQHLAEHDERVRLDERARLEGRQREGSRRRPLDSQEHQRHPRPVDPQDETELLEQPPQTR
jgi:membrane protein